MEKSDKTKWFIAISAMLAIIVLTYIKCTTDIWNSATFICQLLAVVELAYGLRIAEIAKKRKKSYQLSAAERHAYTQYLYQKQYYRYPVLANQMFFIMVRMDIQMENYDRAEEELEKIIVEKCSTEQLKLYYYMKIIVLVASDAKEKIQENRMRYLAIPDVKGVYPLEAELDMWIKQNNIAKMTEAVKKAAAEKKEHPLRTGIISAILAYSMAFYGLWYGINRDAGYEVRQHFAEISVAFITVSLALLIIWGIVSIYRRNCQELSVPSGKNKATLIVIYGAAAIFALIIIGSVGMNVFFGINWTESVAGENGKYTYIAVKEDYGSERRYRTNNPFIMRSVDSLLPSPAITDEKEDEENAPDTDNGNSTKESSKQSESNEDNAQDDTTQYQRDGLTIQNEMLAVYNYLKEQNTLQNMTFNYTASAKGEVYAVVSEVQEEKEGNTVTVRYCLYDNGEKKDADSNPCEEFVLEKVYPDGSHENELVDFYLVNADTMQVTDEKKDTW